MSWAPASQPPSTAKTHVRHLLTKLDERDRVQLVIIAHRTGCPAPAPHPHRRASRPLPVTLRDNISVAGMVP
jgi:hypothetical protein